MIYKLDTKRYDELPYFVGYRVISERGAPDWILEQDTAPDVTTIRGENEKFRWIFVQNPSLDRTEPFSKENRPYILEDHQLLLTSKESEYKAERERSKMFSHLDLARAVIALKNGDTTKLDAIEQKIIDIKTEAPLARNLAQET